MCEHELLSVLQQEVLKVLGFLGFVVLFMGFVLKNNTGNVISIVGASLVAYYFLLVGAYGLTVIFIIWAITGVVNSIKHD